MTQTTKPILYAAKKNIMIGVSTEQNTTNLIPAVQYQALDLFVIIETSKAHADAWSEGMKSVFLKRGMDYDCLVLLPEEDHRIEKIINRINTYLTQFNDNCSVVWNLGGGQKPHNIALWTAFLQRNNPLDKACYSNQEATKPQLEWWKSENGNLQYSREPIQVNLTANEILTTFGFEVRKSQYLFSKTKQLSIAATPDFLKYAEFREYLFKVSAVLPHKRAVEKYSIDTIKQCIDDHAEEIDKKITTFLNSEFSKNASKLRGQLLGSNNSTGLLAQLLLGNELDYLPIQHPTLQKELAALGIEMPLALNTQALKSIGVEKPNAANYFEKISFCRFETILRNNPKHHIVEVLTNLETFKDGEMVAEYDILLVTEWGTLLAFDAKTFDFDKKDADARLHNLEKAAGRYVKMMVVLPFDPHDIDKGYLPKELKNLPNKIKLRKIDVFAIADSRNKSFWLDTQTFQVQDSTCKNGIEIKLFKDCLKHLKLLND